MIYGLWHRYSQIQRSAEKYIDGLLTLRHLDVAQPCVRLWQTIAYNQDISSSYILEI